ncbi:MAG: hypothetical protein JST92_02985, partial [Deltaproteobacteria bacterium]|nr:hypothetical protein [Deltaproteobacteria bacterium]
MTRLASVLLLLSVAACGGQSYNLLAFTPEPAGANCPDGGLAILSGVDTNADGTLQTSEVNASATRYLCNGASGTIGTSGDAGPNGGLTLVRVSTELPGLHCPFGGEKVDLGVDTNGDGVLQTSEVTQTLYSCLVDAAQLGVHIGDVTLDSQSDVALLENARLQLGKIHVTKSFTGALELDRMVAVTGAIDVASGSGLASISMPLVTSLLDLDVNSTGLVALSLPKLDTISRLNIPNGNGLSLIDLSSLTKVASEFTLVTHGHTHLRMPVLHDAGVMALEGEGLEELAAPALVAVDHFHIFQTSLTALSLPRLETAQDVLVQQNALITDVALPALHDVTEMLAAYDNPLLSDCGMSAAWLRLEGKPPISAMYRNVACPLALRCGLMDLPAIAPDRAVACAEAVSWEDAEADCQQVVPGGHLMFFRSDAEVQAARD